MKHPFIRFLWLISGILLIFAGVVTIFNPAGTLASIAFILGLVMLLSGVFDIIIFATTHEGIWGAGWVLADGIFNILIAAFLFGHQIVTAEVIPYIFGMWVIFTGVTRMVTAFDLKKLGIQRWGWLALFGALSALMGVISFFCPGVAAIVISIFIGIFLILNGVSAVFLWIYAQGMGEQHWGA